MAKTLFNRDARKAEAGYLTASQRESCRNCRHRDPKPWTLMHSAEPAQACLLLGTFISLGAICQRYARADAGHSRSEP